MLGNVMFMFFFFFFAALHPREGDLPQAPLRWGRSRQAAPQPRALSFGSFVPIPRGHAEGWGSILQSSDTPWAGREGKKWRKQQKKSTRGSLPLRTEMLSCTSPWHGAAAALWGSPPPPPPRRSNGAGALHRIILAF